MRLSTEEISDSSPPSPPPPISRRSKHHHRRRYASPSPSPTADVETDSVNQEQSSNPDNSNEFETDIPDTENSTQLNSSYYSSSNLIPPTYVNVAPLPIFRGAPEDCPVAHLSRFERVARANNAAASPAMMLRIFPVTLDGEAALWYELSIEPFPDISWEETKSSFLTAFRRPEFVDKARSDLMTIKQGDDETVNAFYLRMQWILKKWPDHGLPDSLLKGIFVDGLREDFQDWIVPQWPESLDEAVRLATSWEQAQSVRARMRREAKCGFCEGKHEESRCEVRRKMKEMWMKSKEEGGGCGEAGSEEESKEGEGVGRVVSFGSRRSQCQCWKHQCWRKLDRNNSVVSEKNVNVE